MASQHIISGVDEVLTTVTHLVGAAGAESFEVSFDAVNRTLADDETPQPTDRIRWTATATFRTPFGRIDRCIGTAVTEPGGQHARSIQYAASRLLDAIGIPMQIVDLEDGEPTR